MSEELKKLENRRTKYTAIFGHFGNRQTKFGTEKTVLLNNVRAGKLFISDHVWVDYEPDLMIWESHLKKGVTIEFEAVAKTYLKDPAFRETAIRGQVEVDYTLTEIKNVRVVEEP